MIKKSSKSPVVVVVLLVIVALVGFFLLKGKGKTPGSTQSEGVFGSIKDAISKSLSLKCEYKVGENTTIAYVKGSNVRIDGSWEGKNNSAAILKENKMWTWDIAKKEGIIFSFENTQSGTQTQATSDQIVGSLENQKQYCKVSVFSDSVFTPPTDVKFQDLSNLENMVNYPGAGE